MLVLNAAALAFVLNVDEMVYRTLTLLSGQTLLERLKPLPRTRTPRWRGLGVRSL